MNIFFFEELKPRCISRPYIKWH